MDTGTGKNWISRKKEGIRIDVMFIVAGIILGALIVIVKWLR